MNTNHTKLFDHKVALFGFIMSNPTEKTHFIATELGMPVLYLKKLQPKLFDETQEKIPTGFVSSMLVW